LAHGVGLRLSFVDFRLSQLNIWDNSSYVLCIYPQQGF
jgi:hypothetical protein